MEEQTIAPEVAESIARLSKAREVSDKSDTPSKVMEAFLPLNVTEGGLSLPPVNMGKVLILESIGSPFLKGDVAGAKLCDMTATLFVLAQRENDPLREIIANGTFQKELDRWADSLFPGTVARIAPQISAHIEKAFSAAVRYGEEGAGVPLADHPSQATDSGGISPSQTP